jgi:hypothetical protein
MIAPTTAKTITRVITVTTTTAAAVATTTTTSYLGSLQKPPKQTKRWPRLLIVAKY